MSWRGDGYPVFLVDSTAYSYPYPVKDSREERLEEEESQIVTRRNGERVHLARRFRFVAKYTFGNLTTAQVQQLVLWKNSWPRVAVTVRPHNDVTTLQVPCWIEELELPPGVANASAYAATVTFRGITPFTGSLIPDENVVVGDLADFLPEAEA